ncbi:MAG: hypothetical protein M1835_004182 [Candelina submexicana]|nr:MAG: hypothetical protein M1835_004182 [Candelina submexicana]
MKTPTRTDLEPLNRESTATTHRSGSRRMQGLMGPCLTSTIEWSHRNDTLRRVTGISDPTVNEAIMSPSPRALRHEPLHQRLEQWIDTTINDPLDARHPSTKKAMSEPILMHKSVYGKNEGLDNGGLEEIEEFAEEPAEQGQKLTNDFRLSTSPNEDWPAPLNVRKPSIRSNTSKSRSTRSHREEPEASIDRKFIQACAQHNATHPLEEPKGKEKVPTISELRRRSRVKFSSTSCLPRTIEENHWGPFVAPVLALNLNKDLPPFPWERVVSVSLDDGESRAQPGVYQPTSLDQTTNLSLLSSPAPNAYEPTTLSRSLSPNTFVPSSLSAQPQSNVYNPTGIGRSQSLTTSTLHPPIFHRPTVIYPPSPTLLVDYALATEQIHNLERIDSISLASESSVSSIPNIIHNRGKARLNTIGRSSFPMKRRTSLLRKIYVRSLPATPCNEGASSAASSVYSREIDGTSNGVTRTASIEEEKVRGQVRTKRGLRFGKLKGMTRKGYTRVVGLKKHITWRPHVHLVEGSIWI